MIIHKVYKFRLYPNIDQEKQLNSFLGTSRFIFNYYLNLKNKLSDMKKDLIGLQRKLNGKQKESKNKEKVIKLQKVVSI